MLPSFEESPWKWRSKIKGMVNLMLQSIYDKGGGVGGQVKSLA